MLSDDQINELERGLFTAVRADVPLLVGKWLPVLFTELRLARAALDAKAQDFLMGGDSDLPGRAIGHSASTPEGDGGGLPDGDEHPRRPEEVEPVAEASGVTDAPPVGGGKGKRRQASRRPKPRRNREAAGPYEGLVVTGGSEPEMGGEDSESVPGSEPDDVEAPASLSPLPMFPHKEVPSW